jgi:CDP-diacylglycerol--glycerol-3-phosphate 3-phosphatidyltransferase
MAGRALPVMASDGMKYLPNILSGLRLAATAPLLVLAWFGEATAFLVVLLLAILSDGIDGWIARRFNAYSALGVRLDSLADYAIYIVIPLGGWWLWPELVKREAFWFGLVVIGYALPGAVALLRFHRLSSYHTWSAKLAVGLLSIGFLVLFAGGPAWPLHIGAPVALLAGIEQTLITLMADRPRDDLPTIVHAVRTFGRRV